MNPTGNSSLHFTPETVLFEWIAAINTWNPQHLVSLYAEDALLLPTFSPHALSTCDAIHHYFQQLAQRPGLSVKLHEKTLRIRSVGPDVFVLSGIYCFRFEVDSEPLSFEARFTLVINTALKSPILHHQSSQHPRNLS